MLSQSESLQNIKEKTFIDRKKVDLEKVDWQMEELKFKKAMFEKNLRIVEIGRDGNCLFRVIAHQAYGDEDEHRLVR